MEDKVVSLDNSKRAAFVQCPALYYWQYVAHLVPKRKREAIRFGSTYHALLQAHREGKSEVETAVEGRKAWDEETEGMEEDDTDFRTLSLAYSAYSEYTNFFPEKLEVVQPEFAYCLPLHQEAGLRVFFEGKIDLIARFPGDSEIYIFDEKTTTYDPFRSQEKYKRSSQLVGYSWAASTFLSKWISLVYVTFLFLKKTKGKVNFSFSRTPYIIDRDMVFNWKRSFINTAKQLAICQDANIFSQSFDSCYTVFGECPYKILCEWSGNDPLSSVLEKKEKEEYIKTFYHKRRWSPFKENGEKNA